MPKLFDKKLYDVVVDVLTEWQQARDSDVFLYHFVCNKFYINVDIYLAAEFLQMMEDKKVPDFQSVTRYRRRAQNKHKHLRGETWAKRRKVGEQLHQEFSTLKQEAV